MIRIFISVYDSRTKATYIYGKGSCKLNDNWHKLGREQQRRWQSVKSIFISVQVISSFLQDLPLPPPVSPVVVLAVVGMKSND